MKLRIFVALTLCVGCHQNASGQAAGSIIGEVQARETGTPVSGAAVVAIEQGRFADNGPSVFHATTDADGTYQITGVAFGQYRLCVSNISGRRDPVLQAGSRGSYLNRYARPRISDYLNPCDWGAGVTVSVGQTGALAPISLERGARVSLRVRDTGNVLAKFVPTSEVRFPILVSLVDDAGLSRPVPVAAQAPGELEYSYVVPGNAHLSLVVRGIGIGLLEAPGATISDAGLTFSVQTSAGSDVEFEVLTQE